jgi:hypothetical protein
MRTRLTERNARNERGRHQAGWPSVIVTGTGASPVETPTSVGSGGFSAAAAFL